MLIWCIFSILSWLSFSVYTPSPDNSLCLSSVRSLARSLRSSAFSEPCRAPRHQHSNWSESGNTTHCRKVVHICFAMSKLGSLAGGNCCSWKETLGLNSKPLHYVGAWQGGLSPGGRQAEGGLYGKDTDCPCILFCLPLSCLMFSFSMNPEFTFMFYGLVGGKPLSPKSHRALQQWMRPHVSHKIWVWFVLFK